jgi:hypothetical protein
MVILTLGGGLGNQMFQYAFARKLQKVTGDGTLAFTGYHLANTDNRADMLFHLQVKDGITMCDERQQAEVEAFQEPLLKALALRRKIARKCPLFSALPDRYVRALAPKGLFTAADPYAAQSFDGIRVEEDGSWTASKAVCALGTKYVEGNFQTFRYWEDIAQEICAELRVKTAPSPGNRALMEEMASCESVCVHVRRGDYLAPEYAHLNVCTESYYRRAMADMQEALGARNREAVFYVFSNNSRELAWIREHYDFTGYKVRYVDLDNPDYEELRLMYSCKHFIISNSTFSWWGQMLSDNPGKLVIAPSVWNRQYRADGIYMPGWQKMEV